MYLKESILLRFYLSQDVRVVKVALQLASWRLVAYKPVAVKVLVFMCRQLTNRTINWIKKDKEKIVVLFASSAFFYLFFFESYEKCNEKM